MINLLPDDIKSDITYARRNTVLRRWIAWSLVSTIGVVVIVFGGLIYMHRSINHYNNQLASSRQSLKDQKVDETQKRVEEISSNTKLALQVLSREILFSKLLRSIGAALPTNTQLSSLQIDKVQGGVQLNGAATDFTAATQLQLNLQDPKNGVFEKADINNITCGDADPKNPLPCDVSIRALFNKNNNYSFIGSTTPTTTGTAR